MKTVKCYVVIEVDTEQENQEEVDMMTQGVCKLFMHAILSTQQSAIYPWTVTNVSVLAPITTPTKSSQN
jgi:hypothetical protein